MVKCNCGGETHGYGQRIAVEERDHPAPLDCILCKFKGNRPGRARLSLISLIFGKNIIKSLPGFLIDFCRKPK